MRWVVYSLLGVNLALLTWNLHTRSGASQAASAARTVASVPAGADQLPLLSELEPNALRARAPSGADAGSGRAGSAAPVDSPPAPDAAASGGPAVAPGTDTDAAPAAAPPAPPAETDVAVSSCLEVGPLGDDAPVEELGAWFRARGASVTLRDDERREVALYWIYFPPAASREAAEQLVSRMREEGVSDVLVVPKGDQANAISLGVFSRTDSRDRRLRELRGKGYQPSVAPRYRTKRGTWMHVTTRAGEPSLEAVEQAWPQLDSAPAACLDPSIAAAGGGSYNAGDTSSAPRRYFFSGQQRATAAASAQ